MNGLFAILNLRLFYIILLQVLNILLDVRLSSCSLDNCCGYDMGLVSYKIEVILHHDVGDFGNMGLHFLTNLFYITYF